MSHKAQAPMYRAITTTALGLICALTLNPARAAETRNLGSGIVYPGHNESTYVNPIGLAEGGKASLLGLWHFSPGSPQIGIAGTYGVAGLGATYASVSGNNVFLAGLAVDMGFTLFGVSLKSVNGSGLDGDVGLAFDLSAVRLAVVARGIDGGLSGIDIGVGAKFGMANVELNVKKPAPFNSDLYLLDAGMSVAVQQFSFSFGVDWHYASEFSEPNLHAGVDFEITQNLAMQLLYRPTPHESLVGTRWALGVRYSF